MPSDYIPSLIFGVLNTWSERVIQTRWRKIESTELKIKVKWNIWFIHHIRLFSVGGTQDTITVSHVNKSDHYINVYVITSIHPNENNFQLSWINAVHGNTAGARTVLWPCPQRLPQIILSFVVAGCFFCWNSKTKIY